MESADYGGGNLSSALGQGAGGEHIVHGTVESDTPGAPAVTFNSKCGPLVSVRLHPSDRTVRCRVASHVAGAGEGEWYPFVGGDEVIVGIAEGNTRAGCTILGRLGNGLDTFPTMVSGQDPTTNGFGFRRMIAPYAVEVGAGVILTQSVTGAQVALDDSGNWVLADASGNSFVMNASGLVWQTSDGAASVQINPSTDQVTIAAKSTSMLFDAAASKFLTGGTLSLGTSGVSPAQHAITLEQVMNLMANLVCALAMASAFDSAGPFGPVAWTAPSAALPLLTTLLTAVLNGAIAPVPIATAGAPGGILDATGLQVLIQTALAVPPTFGAEQPIPLPAPYAPGVGRAGMLY